jgi:hypothetical protein
VEVSIVLLSSRYCKRLAVVTELNCIRILCVFSHEWFRQKGDKGAVFRHCNSRGRDVPNTNPNNVRMASGRGGIGRKEIKQPYSCSTLYSSYHSVLHLINSAIFAYKGL